MNKLYILLLFILFSAQLNAQQVSLYAGVPDSIGQNPTGISKEYAYFNNPYGLAYDSYGNLWVSEWSNHTIRMITPSGMVYVRAGGYLQDCFKNAAGITARLSNPSGICVGIGDTIYFADQGNHVIRKITPYKNLGNTQYIAVKAGKYDSLTPNPNCYVRKPGYADGKWLSAQFNEPVDVCSDKNGNLYVADKNNHCIRKIGTDGNVTTIAGTPTVPGDVDGNASSAKFNYPVGVSITDNGDIYVAEWGNAKLRKISGGKVSTVLEFPPLFNPSDVIFDSRGILYISDLARIIRLEGTKWSVFAGSQYHNETGYKNDTGYAARFNGVRQMVVDPKDYHFVYAADYNTHVIRKITICDPYKPNVQLSGSTIFCKGDKLTLTAPDGFKSYTWSTGETSKSIIVDATKTVWLKVVNNDLCTGYSDTFQITVYSLKPSLIPTKKSFCTGDSAFLVGQSGFDYYTWYKNGVKFIEGINKQTIAVYDSGTYKLEVISGPCKGTSDNIKISIGNLLPTLNISGTKLLCSGDSFIVEPLENYNTYEWKKGTTTISTSKQLIIKEGGTFTLTVSKGTGCAGTSDPLIINYYPKPAKPTITKQGDSLLVSSSLTDNQWYRNDTLIPNAVGQAYYCTKKGWYRVVVTNQYGCFASSEKVPFGGIESIFEPAKSDKIKVFPNPSSGIFNIQINSNTNEEVKLNFVNLLGEIIYSEKWTLKQDNNLKTFELNKLGKGIYFIIVSDNTGIYSSRIIIE